MIGSVYDTWAPLEPYHPADGETYPGVSAGGDAKEEKKAAAAPAAPAAPA